MIDEWRGRTVVCIASGPSLTSDDCERVRQSGHPVIVTNTTFRLCPWADLLVGFDWKWWKAHQSEVVEKFAGRKICVSLNAQKYGAESPYAKGQPWFSVYKNSGACAASIAMAKGAAKVVLLGYDAGFTKGAKHWHGDHPKGMDNCASIGGWARLFRLLARQAGRAGVEVVNASRATALTCFARAELEAVL